MTKQQRERLEKQSASAYPSTSNPDPAQETFTVELSGEGFDLEKANVPSWEVASTVGMFAETASRLSVKGYTITVEK